MKSVTKKSKIKCVNKESKFSPAEVKMSCCFMGLGQVWVGQFAKGALFALSEIAFIVFLICGGVENIIGLFTLGTKEAVPIMGIEGDNSLSMLTWGVTTVILCILFVLLYIANIRDIMFTMDEIKKGRSVRTFKESCRSLINGKFFILTLVIPLVFVCIFTIMPIIFTFLVAFTDYGGETIPPALVSWVGFDNFSVIFTVSEYIGTMGKLLAWNVLWAVGSTLINYFGGLALALLYNSKRLKWKRFWRVFPVLAYAIPSFITLTGFSVMFSDGGPIIKLLKAWGWVSENFTIISFDSKWSLRILGYICCAWISIPSVMFLATGVLSNISTDMYEAAKLDGASPWKQFIHLTLPFVVFATTPVLITSFVNNFNNFSIFYFLRPETVYASGYFYANSTDLLINWIYNLTVDNGLYSLGSALSILLFIIVAVFSLVVYVRSPAYRKEDTYK